MRAYRTSRYNFIARPSKKLVLVYSQPDRDNDDRNAHDDRPTQVVSLQRQLNASADETLRYTRAAEDRRNEVGALSNSLKEEAARAEEVARRGEELRSSINAGWVCFCLVLWCGRGKELEWTVTGSPLPRLVSRTGAKVSAFREAEVEV